MLVTEEENQPSKQHPNTNTPKTLLKIKIRITIFFHAKTTKTAIASGHIGKPHQCEKCLFKKTETNNNFWKVFYWLFNKYYTSQYCIFVQNNKRFNKQISWRIRTEQKESNLSRDWLHGHFFCMAQSHRLLVDCECLRLLSCRVIQGRAVTLLLRSISCQKNFPFSAS